MTTRFVYGAPWQFTVASPTMVAGDSYSDGAGLTYTVVAASVGTTATLQYAVGGQTTKPAATGTLTRTAGTGTASVPWTAVTQAANPNQVNISNVFYVSGDTLTLVNLLQVNLQLIADESVAADVVQLETNKPAIIAPVANGGGSFNIKNSSTSNPIIFQFNATAAANVIATTGPSSALNTTGNYITVATSNGTQGQSFALNFPTTNGAQIDQPPFLQAEADAGAGANVATFPTVGATYTNNGATFTVLSVTANTPVAGQGEIVCTVTGGTPQSQGILTKSTGTGDAVVGFSHVNLEGTTNYRFLIGAAWMTLLNIGGGTAAGTTAPTYTAFSDKSSNAYPLGESLAGFGQTYDLGNAFEYDENNGGAGFGKVYLGKANMFSFGTATTITTAPTPGAYYTDSGGRTFLVLSCWSQSGGVCLNCVLTNGSGSPASSGTLTKGAGIGDATIAFIDWASTGGWVPPNGAKIRMPNIHFTSAGLAFGTTAATRCQVGATLNGMGVANIAATSFSDRITFCANDSLLGGNTLTASGMGLFSGALNTGWSNGDQINGLFSALEKYYANAFGVNFNTMIGPQGSASIWNVISHVKGASGLNAIGVAASPGTIAKLGMLRATSIAPFTGQTSGGVYLFGVSSPGEPLEAGPVYVVGHKLEFQTCKNIRVYELNASGNAAGVLSAASIGPIGFSTLSSYVTVEKVRKIAGGACNYSGAIVLSDGTNSNVTVADVVLDGTPAAGSASRSPISLISNLDTTTYFTNWNITNFNSAATITAGGLQSKYPVRLSGVYTDKPTQQISLSQGGAYFDVVSDNSSPPGAWAQTSDCPPLGSFVTGGGRTAGVIFYMPGCNYTGAIPQFFAASVGTYGTDYWWPGSSVLINLPGIVTYTVRNGTPVKGIAATTAFSSATVTTQMASGAGVTVQFRMCLWGQDITAQSFATLSQANLATAFAAIIAGGGYTSSVGIDLQFQISTSATQAARVLNYVKIGGIAYDTAFAPSEVGFVNMSYSGATAGASVALINGSTVATYEASSSGANTYQYGYSFSGTAADMRVPFGAPYTFLARKAGFNQGLASGATYQLGASVPLIMTASEATTDASVAGITVNGGTNTVSITASKTFGQLYQMAQWWAHQQANMIYPVPVTSNGVQGYASAMNVTVTTGAGVTLNGTGTLSMGANTLTTEFAGTGTYTFTGGTFAQSSSVPSFTGGTLTMPAEGTYSPTISASIVVFNPSAGAVTYHMGGGVYSGTLDLRNANAHAMTVELPSGTTTTTASNTGGAITVSTPALYQSVTISGATAGSRIQVYDLTSSTELFNGTPTFPYTWTDTVPAAATRAIRLRVAYCTSSTANEFIDTGIGTCGTTSPTNAISFQVAPTTDSVYTANLVDGTAITDCSITLSNLHVDVNTGATTWQHIYAFMTYWLSTAVGIADQFLEMTATDQTHYVFATAHGAFKIKNVTTGPTVPLLVTGGNAVPDNGSAATNLLDTTGGSIFCIEGQVVPFTTSSQAVNLATVQAGIAASFSFNGANVNANIAAVNGTTVHGSGTSGSPWGP